MKKLSSLFLPFGALLLLSAASAEAIDRGRFNQEFTGASGPFTRQSILQVIDAAEARNLSGMRYVRPVLEGVLYRGGGAGGESPLDQGELQALCTAGFSAVDFAYSGQAPLRVSCGGNSFVYQSVPNRPDAYSSGVFLQHVYATIKSNLGPVMVECWNGWHESGLLSAYALRQFCGWSGEEASTYWQATLGDKMQPAYNAVIGEIENFSPLPELNISPAEAAEICPR